VRQGYHTLKKPDSAEPFENLEELELEVVWSLCFGMGIAES
jgi:hypothetical protein